jgi:hypothetical protein
MQSNTLHTHKNFSSAFKISSAIVKLELNRSQNEFQTSDQDEEDGRGKLLDIYRDLFEFQMRFVYVIVDYSCAMLDQALYPSLINVSAKHLKHFVQNFFQLNPIAQIGLILCTDRKPNRLVSFSSKNCLLFVKTPV